MIDGHPRTGDLMPVLVAPRRRGAGGLSRATSRAPSAPAYQDNLFAAQFNMQKVTRHVLDAERRDASRARTATSSSSSNRDFHPTDVLEDADGSLLVVDTGGWYKLCCPTSQLAKPDVLGGIYRIRRRGAVAPHDPRGRTIDWPSMTSIRLAQLLGDARPAVQQRAIQQLGSRGAGARPGARATR